jgi:hypothetical protein
VSQWKCGKDNNGIEDNLRRFHDDPDNGGIGATYCKSLGVHSVLDHGDADG